ncbi:hypothetical protein BN946_scf184747.g31 [Trametes cinnabarina]|uniref:Cytochrome P450 n=1 Tax=Pycnoporus cinnabarinus TaxID=5643 RepID=A0A060SXG3_PYCCI|nr:hypothetical protein BN946_scf184747.g31 [Trametes cinnabarina]
MVVYLIRQHLDPLNSIPADGPFPPLLSHLGAIRYLRGAEGAGFLSSHASGRDPYSLQDAVNFAHDVFNSAFIINFFQDFLWPYRPHDDIHFKEQASPLPMLVPIREERHRMYETYGDDWEGMPVTSKEVLIALCFRLTRDPPSGLFFNALYNLAANPLYIEPLRVEVERVISEEGSKASLGKMIKIDSFLKESMRLADGTFRVSPTPLHDLLRDENHAQEQRTIL